MCVGVDVCLCVCVCVCERERERDVDWDKTKVLLVIWKADEGIGILTVVDGVTLPLKIQVHSLGVLLDSSLSLDAQVSAVALSAFAQLKLVHQLRPFREMSDLAAEFCTS